MTTSPSGLVTVTGGKLTTYREMAADAVDAALAVAAGAGDPLPRMAGRSRTRKLRLRGADGWSEAMATHRHLAERYGGETGVLTAMIDAEPALGEPLVPGLPYLRAEAVYAARYEMARPSTTCSPAAPGPGCGMASPPPRPRPTWPP